jgi:hypothetical protein
MSNDHPSRTRETRTRQSATHHGYTASVSVGLTIQRCERTPAWDSLWHWLLAPHDLPPEDRPPPDGAMPPERGLPGGTMTNLGMSAYPSNTGLEASNV